MDDVRLRKCWNNICGLLMVRSTGIAQILNFGIWNYTYYLKCKRKRENLREKPAQTPIRPPRIPLGVTRRGWRASALNRLATEPPHVPLYLCDFTDTLLLIKNI